MLGLTVLATLAITSSAGTARGQEPPLLPHAEVVSLRQRVEVRIEARGPDTVVAAGAGRHVAEATFAGIATELSVERLDATSGPAALVRLRGPGGAYAALLAERGGHPAIVWSGRTDLHGDPGERTADAIETRDRTGDGRPDAVVGQAREGVALCDGTSLLLFPSALDPQGTLRPVALARLGGEATELTASAASPGPSAPPHGATLQARGATSAVGISDAAALSPPRAIADGNLGTSWVEGRGGAGAGELVVARVDASGPVRAIALGRPTTEGVVAPRSLWIRGDVGPTLHVTWPEGDAERVWVILPAPAAWTCVAIAIDRGPSDDAALRVGLAEVEAYTDVDFGGIASLVEVLVAEGDDAERTADWLARSGPAAIDAVSEAWERLSGLGHRRAIRVAAAHPRLPSAIALLERAAADDDADVRSDAIAVLVRGDDSALAGLVRVAAGDHGDDAARALAELDRGYDLGPLLAAVHGTAVDRVALRNAIAARLAREPRAPAEEALSAFAASAEVASIAALAAPVALVRPDLGRALVEAGIAHAESFVDRYRLARGAERAEPSDRIDAWLRDQASGADEWMLRDAALAATHTRQRALVIDRLADPYPRVRATAVGLLASDATATDAIVGRVTTDPWPLVRVAALDALSGRAEELDVLHARIGDVSPMVREHAIARLSALGDRTAWPLLMPLFLDDDEWPRVTAAALEYASALCLPDAGDAIEAVMRRGTRDGAWAPHVDVAVLALRIALRLGGDAAERATLMARRSASEEFQPVLDGQGALPACAAP